jgi:hypothetical protein
MLASLFPMVTEVASMAVIVPRNLVDFGTVAGAEVADAEFVEVWA